MRERRTNRSETLGGKVVLFQRGCDTAVQQYLKSTRVKSLSGQLLHRYVHISSTKAGCETLPAPPSGPSPRPCSSLEPIKPSPIPLLPLPATVIDVSISPRNQSGRNTLQQYKRGAGCRSCAVLHQHRTYCCTGVFLWRDIY